MSIQCTIVPVTPYQQNCSIIKCEVTGKAAIVDPGGDVDRILAALAQMDGSLEKIILTHAHLDHCAAADILRRQLQVSIEGPHPPPAELDYEMWIGPAAMQDYIECRVHKNWRWDYNIGGGQLLDWIGHHCDIAHWGMDMDSSGPSEVKPVQVDMPARTEIWNTATKYRAEATYAGDITMVIAGGHDDIKMGTKWIGTDGWVYVNRNGAYDSSKPELKKSIKVREGDKVVDGSAAPKLGDDVIKTRLYATPGHHRNFLDCVKSRQPTVTPVETAHRSATPGHLALISFLVNRPIKWDPVKEEIIGDAEASKLLGREYRGPWKLEA